MGNKEYLIKRYNDLKEEVIDRYEYFYHVELLTDIGEEGKVGYLFGDESELLYNVGLSSSIKSIIDLNLESGDYDLLIKLVELKKITDRRILSNPKYDENFVNEFIFDIEDTSSKKPIIKFNSSVTNKEDILQEIYTFLKKEGYIGCNKEVFISHFEPSEEWSAKILWLGNLISLVGLIDDLFIKNILPSIQKRRLRNKTVLNHFKNEKGNFNNASVKTEGTNICETKKYKKIHDFITSLKVDFD